MDQGGSARIYGPTFRLCDNLEEPPRVAYVGSTGTSVDVVSAVVYCTAVAAELNDGNSDMSIEAIAELLVAFYGFSPGAVTPWGRDINVWEERRKHFAKGEQLASYAELRNDPTYHRDGLIEAIFARLDETVAA